MSELKPLDCVLCPFEAGNTALGCYPAPEEIFHLSSEASQQIALCALRRLQRERTDALTGMVNYSTFKGRIAECMQDGRERNVLVGFVDGNEMKKINDEHGHAVGDDVIMGLGHRLESSMAAGIGDMLALHLRVRPERRRQDVEPLTQEQRIQKERRRGARQVNDLVARRSGDEFVLACFDVEASEAEVITKRIAQALTTAFSVKTASGLLDVSAGVSFHYLNKVRSAKEVMAGLEAADQKLNDQKSANRQKNPRS